MEASGSPHAPRKEFGNCHPEVRSRSLREGDGPRMGVGVDEPKGTRREGSGEERRVFRREEGA